MSTQPKETYGLNLVPARAHVAQRPCPGCLAHACKAKRTYDGGLVDESEEPARRRQARALIGARLARGRGCVEAASSPRLLLAEHRGPSGAQEGGRADEEQQHDEEGVEVEQRRLRPRQAASAPRWVGWSGVLLRGAHHAAGCLGALARKFCKLERKVEKRTQRAIQHKNCKFPVPGRALCWKLFCEKNAFNGNSERGRCAATAAALCSPPPPAAARTADRPGRRGVTLWQAEAAFAIQTGQELAAPE